MKHWPLSLISCQTAAYCFFLNQSLSYTSIDWLSYFGQMSFYMLICLMLLMPLIGETKNMYLVLQITEHLQTSVTHYGCQTSCTSVLALLSLWICFKKEKDWQVASLANTFAGCCLFVEIFSFLSSHRACMSVCLALVFSVIICL